MEVGSNVLMCCWKWLVLPQEAKRQLRKRDNYSLRQHLRIINLLLSCTLFDPPDSCSQVRSQTQSILFQRPKLSQKGRSARKSNVSLNEFNCFLVHLREG